MPRRSRSRKRLRRRSSNCWFLKRSQNSKKKWTVIAPNGKKVSFGAKGYSDYTKHKDRKRMLRYIKRHNKMGNQNWTYSGRYTAGFWARHLLWGKPSIAASKRAISKRFKGIKFC